MAPLSSQPAQVVNPEELYNVICAAASQDPAQIKASAERLKQLLEMVGTFDTLSEIAATRTLPLQVRQQSIIQLKNSSHGHWRSRRLLTDQHRTNIKRRCLELLNEQDDVIAECNEVIISKVARQEYPASWPTVIEDVAGIISTNMAVRYGGAQLQSPESFTTLRRALEALNAILKEFVNMKMLSGIKTCGQIVRQLHMIMQNHYSTAAGTFAALNPSTVSSSRSAEDLLIAHIVFKCVVKIAGWVWPRSKGNTDPVGQDLQPWLVGLFQNSAVQVQTLSELRINLVVALRSGAAPSTTNAEQAVTLLTRHVRLFGKFFRRLQQLDAARFVALPTCSDLIMYYWSKVVQSTTGPNDYIQDSPTAVFPLRFLVQAMVLFKESLAQWAPVRKDGTENVHVLSQTFVEDAVRLLVTRFIPLDPSDLEEWMSDPEEWVNVEEHDNDQWEYALRPCGERVLMTLAHQYRDYVVPLLRTTFQQLISQPTNDLSAVLQKEALYCAIGRCANKLKDEIPFDQWVSQSLLPEARSTNTSYPIIKRRIAWLIGKWISNDCSSPNNPTVWEILVYLMQDRGPGTDAVVRLTAAITLKECVDTVAFDSAVFAPYLSVTITELIKLIVEADSMESKRHILGSLNTIIERMDTEIDPLLATIAQPLPQIWTSAEDEWLLKASLLETVTKLIQASKEQSSSLMGLTIPLVRDSFTPGALAQLDVDALDLWQAALRNTNTLDSPDGTTSLFDLLPLALNLAANNLDLLGRILCIVESYIILDAKRVLQACALELFTAFEAGMKQAMQMNVKQMAIAVNLALQLAPSELWGQALHVSGLFAYIVKTLEEEKAATEILTEYVYVMARIALMDKHMFLQLMSATGPNINMTEAQVWEAVLNQWWTRFDNMSEPRHRKLAAMGMASLVSTGKHEVLDRLPTEICNLWLDVLCEIREATAASSGTDAQPTLMFFWDRPPESFFRETEGTAEYKRREAVYHNDPARSTLLTAFISGCLQEAEATCGGAAALQERYLQKADASVLSQIQAELSGRGPGSGR